MLWCGQPRDWPSYTIRHHIADHLLDPLKYLFEKPALSRRLARWHLLLAELIALMLHRIVKEQPMVDHLAETRVDGYQPITDLFPDEFILNIKAEE